MCPIPALSRDVREMLSPEEREVERGRCALHVACSMDNVELAQLISAFGARIDIVVPGSDETPAQIAATDYPQSLLGAWAKFATETEHGALGSLSFSILLFTFTVAARRDNH